MIAVADKIFYLLIDTTVKASVLLAVTAVIAILSRRASASFRHLVWTLGLGCALFLPLLSLGLPHWWVVMRTPAIQHGQAALSPPPAMAHLSDVNATQVASGPPAPISPGSGTTAAASTPPLPSHVIEPTHFPWTALAFFIWAAGAVLVLMRMISGLMRAKSVTAASVRIVERRVADTKTAVMTAMGLRRPVSLLSSANTTRVTVLITWGALRPVILLPAAAAEWPEDKLRSALLHEMAHVRRQDWLLQTLAYFTCALHWFNPLVWMAARKMRDESETACDDLVLAAGVPAQEYARHLLDVALLARGGRQIGAVTVAMAQTPRIERRLRKVLATGLMRRRVGRRLTAAALAISVMLTLPLAAMRLVPPAEAQHNTSSTSPSVSLTAKSASPKAQSQDAEGGGIVHLVGVSYSPSAYQCWWGADGGLLPNPPKSFPEGIIGPLHPSKGEQARELRIEADGTAAVEGYKVEVPTATTTAVTISEPQRRPEGKAISFHIGVTLPDSARACTVRVGVPFPSWRTLDYHASPSRHGQEAAGGGDAYVGDFTVAFSPPSVLDGKLAFTVTDTVKDVPTRVVAQDRRGRLVTGQQVGGDASAGGVHQRTLLFPTLRLSDIRSLQFQARPYQWLVFEDIPLQPSTSLPSAASSIPQTPDSAAAHIPDSAAHIALGQKLQEKGQPRDGIPEFRRAVQLAPNNADAQYQLAQALYSINYKRVGTTTEGYDPPQTVADEAIKHMKRAVALSPHDELWQSNLGTYLGNKGQYMEAGQCFKRALHLLSTSTSGPDHSSAERDNLQRIFDNQWQLGAVLVKAGQYREAVPPLREALWFNPQADWVLMRYGDALSGIGHHAEAKTAWKKVVALDGTRFSYGHMAQERLTHR